MEPIENSFEILNVPKAQVLATENNDVDEPFSICSTTSEIDRLTEQVMNQNRQLSEALQRSNAVIKELNEKNKDFKEQLEAEKAYSNKLNEIHRKKDVEILGKDKEIKSLNAKIQLNQQASVRYEILVGKHEELRKQNCDKIKFLQDEVDRWKTSFQRLQKDYMDIKNVNEQAAKRESENPEQVLKTNEEIKLHKDEIATLKAENLSLTRQVSELQQQQDKKNKEINIKSEDIKLHTDEIATLKAENLSLTKQVSELQQLDKKNKEINIKLSQEMSILSDELKECALDRRESLEKVKSISKENEVLNADLRELKEQMYTQSRDLKRSIMLTQEKENYEPSTPEILDGETHKCLLCEGECHSERYINKVH